MASSSSGSNLSSQRKMRNVSEDIDYISRLPEPVMLYILSLLPTKDLLVVSLLSKLWKNNVVNHLSSVSSSLKFDELEMVRSFITRSIQRDRANFHSAYSTQQYLMQLIGAAKMHYVDFVHQALMLHTGCTIKNLHLSFCHQGNERYRARVASWVRFCLMNKIEVLYVDFSRGEPLRAARSDRPYELPDAGFSTRVLQNLTLAYCKIRPIHFGVLISLQKLCLKQVKFFYCSLEEIASKCPILEEVTLDHCVFPNEFMVSEQDVKIKKLIMIDCKTDQLPMFTIDMSFPDLLSLVFIGRYLMMSSLRNASQLVDAMINVQQIYADHVQGDALASMLNGLDHCKTLTLNAWCIQVISTDPIVVYEPFIFSLIFGSYVMKFSILLEGSAHRGRIARKIAYPAYWRRALKADSRLGETRTARNSVPNKELPQVENFNSDDSRFHNC